MDKQIGPDGVFNSLSKEYMLLVSKANAIFRLPIFELGIIYLECPQKRKAISSKMARNLDSST